MICLVVHSPRLGVLAYILISYFGRYSFSQIHFRRKDKLSQYDSIESLLEGRNSRVLNISVVFTNILSVMALHWSPKLVYANVLRYLVLEVHFKFRKTRIKRFDEPIHCDSVKSDDWYTFLCSFCTYKIVELIFFGDLFFCGLY